MNVRRPPFPVIDLTSLTDEASNKGLNPLATTAIKQWALESEGVGVSFSAEVLYDAHGNRRN